MCLRRTIVREECSKLSLPPLKCNPTHSSQKSFFSLFLVKKLVCNFHWGISGENVALLRMIASRENDLWLKCARGRCHVTSQWALIMVIFVWAKNVLKHCPWERWVTYITCIFPVRMCTRVRVNQLIVFSENGGFLWVFLGLEQFRSQLRTHSLYHPILPSCWLAVSQPQTPAWKM